MVQLDIKESGSICFSTSHLIDHVDRIRMLQVSRLEDVISPLLLMLKGFSKDCWFQSLLMSPVTVCINRDACFVIGKEYFLAIYDSLFIIGGSLPNRITVMTFEEARRLIIARNSAAEAFE